MPKHGDQKVLPSGICTWPPSASASNARFAAASSGTAYDNENPLKLVLPEQPPSDAITVPSPIFSDACMILFSDPGGSMPSGTGSGLSLNRIIVSTCAPIARW